MQSKTEYLSIRYLSHFDSLRLMLLFVFIFSFINELVIASYAVDVC